MSGAGSRLWPLFLAVPKPQSGRRFGKAILDRADRGEFSADAYLEAFGRLLGKTLSRAQWVEARRISMTPDLPMLSLVRSLGQSHRLALLTNNDRLLSETIDNLFPELRPLFGPHLYVSADLTLAKPDPDIFRAVCDRVGTETKRSFLSMILP